MRITRNNVEMDEKVIRDLDWPDCYNVRDLGGLPTIRGETTRVKKFVRSDVLGRLTSEGKNMVVDYEIRSVIDLRFPEEFDLFRAVSFDNVSVNEIPAYYNIPFGKDDSQFWNKVYELEDPSTYYGIWIETYQKDVATIVRTVLESQPGGVVFHCHSGKDRTGISAERWT
jgi:protein-tyrosine phosphatase